MDSRKTREKSDLTKRTLKRRRRGRREGRDVGEGRKKVAASSSPLPPDYF